IRVGARPEASRARNEEVRRQSSPSAKRAPRPGRHRHDTVTVAGRTGRNSLERRPDGDAILPANIGAARDPRLVRPHEEDSMTHGRARRFVPLFLLLLLAPQARADGPAAMRSSFPDRRWGAVTAADAGLAGAGLAIDPAASLYANP